jgi:A/G-specific adenine glycosylase
MLQQTRMEVVLGRYQKFLTRFPSIRSLASSTEEEVTAAWSGLGYYRRARMLREAAIAIVVRFGGKLPSDAATLMTIAGIGRYTAGAIASIAYDRRAPIVDGNIARIIARLYGIETLRATWDRADELVRAAASPRMFNQALMEIGALICKPKNPNCPQCPLRTQCFAFRQRAVDSFPRKAKRPATRKLRIPLYVVTDARGRILMRRESGKLMTGMFHLPHGNGLLFRGSRFASRASRRVGEFQHTVTNRRITFEVFIAVRPATRDARPATWIHPHKLSEIPIPSYVRKALQLAGMSE